MLLSAIYSSNSGLQAASTTLDVSGNNIANLNTAGFKTSVASFQDLLYTGDIAGAGSAGQTLPEGTQVGSGTTLESITPQFSNGQQIQTGQPLDLAINGAGFFPVTLADGTTGYTRAGSFTTDSSGQLVTSDGFILAPGITIPPEASSVSIGTDGTVTAVTPTGTQNLGQIQLTTFPNPAGLLQVGNTTFAASPASGTPVTGTAGTQGLGTIQQGALEGSNVDLNNELVQLIIAQQAFTYNAQALTAENEVLTTTTSLIQ